jgi:hypothetical protein
VESSLSTHDVLQISSGISSAVFTPRWLAAGKLL